jgi:MFS-type transporter involved in bile tolerance (Atg22 family)
LIIGAYADFGSFRPNILIALSIIAFGIGFGWLGVHKEDQWMTGLGLYIVGLIAYQLCLTYWTAAFPGLARNTRALRDEARKYENGEISLEQYEFKDSMKRNEISNVAFYIQSLGEILILAVIVGIMFGIGVNDSEQKNNWGLSVLIAFATGVWLLLALPWFALEKKRPGQDPGMNIVIAGFWQLYRAITQIWQLKQSFFYLIGKFIVACVRLVRNSSRCILGALLRTHRKATKYQGTKLMLTTNPQATSFSVTLLILPSLSSAPYKIRSSHTTLSTSHTSSSWA